MEGGKFESGTIKLKERHHDFPLAGKPYDLRVGIAKEIVKQPQGLKPDDWQTARIKVMSALSRSHRVGEDFVRAF
jgi:hypothetical protein